MKPLGLLFISLFAPVAVGCGVMRPAPSRDVESAQVVTVTETVRDTVVMVEPDSSLVTALVECNERGQAILREVEQLRSSERLQTSVGIDTANRLTVRSKVDSMGIYLQYKERYKEEQKVKVETITQTVEVNVLTWWQEFLMWCGSIVLVAVPLAVLAWIVKKYLKII